MPFLAENRISPSWAPGQSSRGTSDPPHPFLRSFHPFAYPLQAGIRGDPGTSAVAREGTAEQSERNFHLAPFVPKRQVIAEGVPDHRVGAITGRPGAKNAFLIIFLFLNIVNRMSPTPVSQPP